MKAGYLFGLCLVLFYPLLADAQGVPSQDSEQAWTARPKIEVTASIAMAHPFRFRDHGFGNHFNFGVGTEFSIWRGLRIGGEMNRTFGLSPSPAKCGAILAGPARPLPCIGTAGNGLSSVTAGSFTAAYFFGEGRVQPYLLGGISILNAKGHTSVSIVHEDYVEFREESRSATGIGPTFGAGLRASINRRISIRPEVRFSDGTSLSSLNLSQWRISIGAAYGW